MAQIQGWGWYYRSNVLDEYSHYIIHMFLAKISAIDAEIAKKRDIDLVFKQKIDIITDIGIVVGLFVLKNYIYKTFV